MRGREILPKLIFVRGDAIGLSPQNALTWQGVTHRTALFHPISVKTLIQTQIATKIGYG
jgi:hypothetical protein